MQRQGPKPLKLTPREKVRILKCTPLMSKYYFDHNGNLKYRNKFI